MSLGLNQTTFPAHLQPVAVRQRITVKLYFEEGGIVDVAVIFIMIEMPRIPSKVFRRILRGTANKR